MFSFDPGFELYVRSNLGKYAATDLEVTIVLFSRSLIFFMYDCRNNEHFLITELCKRRNDTFNFIRFKFVKDERRA